MWISFMIRWFNISILIIIILNFLTLSKTFHEIPVLITFHIIVIYGGLAYDTVLMRITKHIILIKIIVFNVVITWNFLIWWSLFLWTVQHAHGLSCAILLTAIIQIMIIAEAALTIGRSSGLPSRTIINNHLSHWHDLIVLH